MAPYRTRVDAGIALAVPPGGTQELFTKFGTEPKFESSSSGEGCSTGVTLLRLSLGRFRFGPWCRKPKRLAYCCQPLRLCWQRRHHSSDFSRKTVTLCSSELRRLSVLLLSPRVI